MTAPPCQRFQLVLVGLRQQRETFGRCSSAVPVGCASVPDSVLASGSLSCIASPLSPLPSQVYFGAVFLQELLDAPGRSCGAGHEEEDSVAALVLESAIALAVALPMSR